MDSTLNSFKYESALKTDGYKFSPVILDRYQTSSTTYVNLKDDKPKLFISKLMGEQSPESILSPFTTRILLPFIWRDFETRPPKLRLLEEIVSFYHLDELNYVPTQHPIDYCYFKSRYLRQVNQLLCDTFWAGIDVSEWKEYPDYGIIALYKCKVIGCAFMTPEGYICYLAVHPEWRSVGIASFMLFHFTQTLGETRDITLHVSATNSAMILYQHFGFKPEEFILDFYRKYYPDNSDICKHAFFLRLRKFATKGMM